ncbi:MAG: AmmeMemoRadiSam system protein A [Candidatus Marinimicrobia bacterium]|nr:AmmeMemoRadiSam system protein A [Candidatus Neomarinimicrobiota bacterium]
MDHLTNDDKNFLLSLARNAIRDKNHNENVEIPTVSALKRKQSAFVTIRHNGTLRGCVGRLENDKRLYQLIPELAIRSAYDDWRFHSINRAELDGMEIEISLLSHFRTINTIDDILIGKHGILLEKDNKNSVFLPKVAVEQNWDVGTTLNNLAIKAGLDQQDWKIDSIIQIFTAQIFSDKKCS